MRTPEEIVAEIKKHEEGMFDFTGDVLLSFLDFEHAKEFLKPNTWAWQWAECQVEATDEGVLKEMREYMKFAWGKCLDHRGLSAGRSTNKMEAWLWLLNDGFGVDAVAYTPYGAPKLYAICKQYDFEIPETDGEMLNRMRRGKACSDECESCLG